MGSSFTTFVNTTHPKTMEVVYWQFDGIAQGRLDFIRYLLNHAKVDYTLEKIAENFNDEFLAWHGKQKRTLASTKNPIINLPYIVTDEGEYITETAAIMMYLGEKFDYYGENLVEKTRINQMLMRIVDLRADVKSNVMFSPKTSENKIKFANLGLAVYVGQFENCVKIWGCKY